MIEENTPECSKCGYLLHGLGVSGHCPECGQAFDLGSGKGLVSSVSQATERGDLLIRRIRTIFLALCTFACMGIALLLSSVNGSHEPMIWGGFLGAIFALATVTSYIYERPGE